jgi:nitrate reductase gamma subunit
MRSDLFGNSMADSRTALKQKNIGMDKMLLGELLVFILFFISLFATILSWRVVFVKQEVHHTVLVMLGSVLGFVVFILTMIFLAEMFNVAELIGKILQIEL